ncbi:hypothetical protein FVR03_22825 [Pontibacter qinzhouensis]|uniref:YdhG-like domain-containing protein n=1 Tax=Pontibacter qinzhouensis TaxID=2603253 RepID=A0A5C8IQ95_9BACT|nr:DUF1801 domain-containing protein [Pontibacter qinzhouensis]TXK23269.1 hypothetical protein FVR03_22825 [Pontibacter qinzhouensis]
MKAPIPATVDDYIAGFPEDIQLLLHQMRHTVQAAAPEAVETIKYAMPTYVLEGNLVHFAAFKNHIGFYTGPSGIEAFEAELAGYKKRKGTIQFPFSKPLPLQVVSSIVRFSVEENKRKALKKKQQKTDLQ